MYVAIERKQKMEAREWGGGGEDEEIIRGNEGKERQREEREMWTEENMEKEKEGTVREGVRERGWERSEIKDERRSS